MGIGLEFSSVIRYLTILILLYAAGTLILRYFRFPAKLIITILANSLMGLGMLILVNAVLVNFGYTLPVNPFNLIFTAIFGLPGVICLTVLMFIL